MERFRRCLPLPVAVLAAALLLAGSVAAQQPPSLSLPQELGFSPFGSASNPNPIEYSTEFQLREGSSEGVLKIKAIIDPAWHTFSTTQGEGGPLPTVIQVQSPEVELAGNFVPDAPPRIHKEEEFWGDLPIEQHQGAVEWTAPIRLKEGVSPESLEIQVSVEAQACTNEPGQCIPQGGKFAAKFTGYRADLPLLSEAPPLAPANGSRSQPAAASSSAAISQSTSADAPPADATRGPAETQTAPPIGLGRILVYVGFGLLGGLLLNLMPCVLPVIGLKVLALAEQAHLHRGEVLKLNVWFTIGIVSVFMILATLASAFTLSWGEQFTDTTFKITITAVVFAMALSFLGIWEIPIPGFVGRGVSNDLQQKEGALGAFFKGVFTTILSTPCSGPALGAVFAVIVGQPAYIAYLLFFSIGLGMALPYLLIGLFPSLLKMLPKPGQWMETFKHVMGFVLLLTVAYLFTTINSHYFIATWTLLIGVWFGCWLVGRIPITASGGRKLRSWLTAATVVAATALVVTSEYFAAVVLPPLATAESNGEKNKLHLIEWQPYSPDALDAALADGKTVMVEFTAQWCLTCKLNMLRAINTQDVANLVENHDIVPLLADWTDRNDRIKQALGALKSNSIPLLAIYPAGNKENVIVLRDVISKSQLVEALEQAGPSQGAGTVGATAMTTPATVANTRN